MSPTIQDKPKTKKPRKPTLKQKAFVDAYINPESPTYSNGTQSALQAYNTVDSNIAGSMAIETLQSPTVQTYIEQINAAQGNSIEERSIQLALCTKGLVQSHTVSEQTDRDGNVISKTKVTKDMSAKDILHAIDLSNKVEGIYNRASIQEHVAKREYDIKVQAMRDEMSKRLQARKVN